MKLLLTVQYIPDRDSRVMDEAGFRIPRVGFRIPGTGFRIPKPWIPDSKGKKMLDSGFRIPLRGAGCTTCTKGETAMFKFGVRFGVARARREHCFCVLFVPCWLICLFQSSPNA